MFVVSASHGPDAALVDATQAYTSGDMHQCAMSLRAVTPAAANRAAERVRQAVDGEADAEIQMAVSTDTAPAEPAEVVAAIGDLALDTATKTGTDATSVVSALLETDLSS